MKNSGIADYVAQTMAQITKSAAHRELFGLSKIASEKKEDECGDEMNADIEIKDPLVVHPSDPKKSDVLKDVLKSDDNNSSLDFEAYQAKGGDLESFIHSKAFKNRYPDAFHALVGHFDQDHIDESYPQAAQVLDEEIGLESSAGFDVAIDSLLTASAALDDLGMEKTATLSLKLASLVVEAKKSDKDKKGDEKAKKAKEKKEADEQKAKDKLKKDKEKEKFLKEKELEKAKKAKEKQKADEQKAKDKLAKDKAKEKEEKEKAKLKADKEKAKK